jgi:AcrR family transcriptional regulator
MIAAVQRRPGLSHGEFVEHWLERHVPLALEHHVGLVKYVTGVVDQAALSRRSTIRSNCEQYDRMGAAELDERTGAARIRDAALRLVAERGFAATSIRSVADAAGVSPGLVQHHFRSKAELRRALDAFVVRRVSTSIPLPSGDGPPAKVARQIGDAVTELIRSNPLLFAYVRRSLIEGDEAGLQLFDAMVRLTRSRLEKLDQAGALRVGVDLGWAALHIVLFDAGALLLETAVNRHLEAPLLSDAGLARWGAATTALLTQGIFRSGRRRPRTERVVRTGGRGRR